MPDLNAGGGGNPRGGFNGKRLPPTMPFVVDLCQDPFERYLSEFMRYLGWMQDKLRAFLPAQGIVGQFLQSFREFPPSQKVGSFGTGQTLEAIEEAASQGGGKQRKVACPNYEETTHHLCLVRSRHRRRAHGFARATRIVAGWRGARHDGRAARGARRRGGAAGVGPWLLAGAQ